MYIPIWILLILIVIFVVVSKRKTVSQDTLPTIGEMWEEGNRYKDRVLEKSPISGMEDAHSFDMYREIIKAAEIDLLRLRERYKYDSEKQKQMAQDWIDIARSTEEMKTASEVLDMDWEDDAYDRFNDSTKESVVIIKEVSKRIENILKKESVLKPVIHKIQKQAEAI